MNKEKLLLSLKRKGFSENILKAFSKIQRERFVPMLYKSQAYEDHPLPIGRKATISQPYTIAYMLELLDVKKDSKILEIGSGSGYVLALMSEIASEGEICGIEISKELVEKSRKLLKKNVSVHEGDGKNGLKRLAPYDRILVSAAYSSMPYHLADQLREGGVIVVPVSYSIYCLKKEEGKIVEEEHPGFVFVGMQ